jgi:putative oxidoreductase
MDRQAAQKVSPGLSAAGLAARLILGAVFLFAGAQKAAGPVEEFAVIISGYGLLPPGMTMGAAAVIPWLEVFLGLSLMAGYFTREAAAALGALSASFILALLSVKLRGYELPNCGCFGGGIHLTMWQAMALDAALLACAAAAFKAGSARLSLDRWAEEGT